MIFLLIYTRFAPPKRPRLLPISQNKDLNLMYMRKTWIQLILVGLLVFPVWSCQGQQNQQPKTVDQSFGQLVNTLSGKGGYFDTDNLISNESSYLHIIPQLHELNIKGGAYLGVGPDQNFSYIAHIQPEIAIIVDIRRDNMLMHLFYKALFELSAHRLQFLSHLFARKIETGIPGSKHLGVDSLMNQVQIAESMGEGIAELQHSIEQKLKQYNVGLSDKDLAVIRRFHNEFIARGPGLRFTSHNRSPRAYYPTYRQLIVEKDVTGNNASFLSQESLFQFLKEMHENDLIIPVVGNFADPDAIPAIGAYLKGIEINISAFYTSNVEYYLMYQGQFPAFLDNLSQLPLKENGVMIRSYFNRFRSSHPKTISGYASTQLLQSFDTMIDHPEATYSDLIFEYYLP